MKGVRESLQNIVDTMGLGSNIIQLANVPNIPVQQQNQSPMPNSNLPGLVYAKQKPGSSIGIIYALSPKKGANPVTVDASKSPFVYLGLQNQPRVSKAFRQLLMKKVKQKKNIAIDPADISALDQFDNDNDPAEVKLSFQYRPQALEDEGVFVGDAIELKKFDSLMAEERAQYFSDSKFGTNFRQFIRDTLKDDKFEIYIQILDIESKFYNKSNVRNPGEFPASFDIRYKYGISPNVLNFLPFSNINNVDRIDCARDWANYVAKNDKIFVKLFPNFKI